MNTQQVLIETLTPLHIGSGRLLQGNTEYLYFAPDRLVSVIDERKVLGIIGEENLDHWIGVINRGEDLLGYLRQRKPNLHPIDTSRRLLTVQGRRAPGGNQTVREQLFSGNGQPLLPGSSLKGAIRTAILNALIQQNPGLARQISSFKELDRNGKVKYRGGVLEAKYTRSDRPNDGPNHDVFRLLRIGDAHFDKTVCLLAETLNELGDGRFEMKESVRQFIECIPAGNETLCRVQIPAELKARLNEPRYRETATKIPHRNRMEWATILADINVNTNRLIQKEIDRYQHQHLPDGATEYLETLTAMLTDLKPNQCIIRVGFGTGYLNMTGGWAEEQWRNVPIIDYQAEMADLGQAVRRTDRYNGLALPKSRKMVLDGIPLGFLKLTLFSETEFTEWQAGAAAREAARVQQAQAEQAKAAAEAAGQEEARQAAEAETRRLAEEARKPTLFTGTLKQGQQLDAEVVAGGVTNKVKVYAAGYETKTFDLIGYKNAIAVGTVIIVTADQLNGKKVLLQVRYVKPK